MQGVGQNGLGGIPLWWRRPVEPKIPHWPKPRTLEETDEESERSLEERGHDDWGSYMKYNHVQPNKKSPHYGMTQPVAPNQFYNAGHEWIPLKMAMHESNPCYRTGQGTFMKYDSDCLKKIEEMERGT